MRRPDTWMPFYVGDYLADTMHLTCVQHGAYLLLIFAYWRAGEALLDDDEELAAITKSTAAEWKKLRRTMARFFVVGEGKWHHKRIDTEIEKASKIKIERSKAGAEGAVKRWQKHGKRDDKPMANAIAEPSQSARQSDAPSPTSSLRSEVSGTDVPGGSPPVDQTKIVFDRGLKVLGGDTPANRRLLGKYRNTYGEPILIAAIVECEAEVPIDAIGYLTACCERRKSNGSRRPRAEQIADLGEWARRTDEREGIRGDYEAAD